MDLPLFRPFHGKPIYLPTCGIVLVEKYQACSMVFSFDVSIRKSNSTCDQHSLYTLNLPSKILIYNVGITYLLPRI